jgi:FkbM family methyltransferase
VHEGLAEAGSRVMVSAVEGRSTSLPLKFLAVRGSTAGDSLRLYIAYMTAALMALFFRSRLKPVGHYLVGTSLVSIHVEGIRMLVRPGTEDLAVALLTHEPQIAPWFRPARGQVVVDVGAHIGTYTVRGGAAGATVIAFEPNPETFAILSRNVEANGLTSVRLMQCAASDRSERRMLGVPTGFSGKASFVHTGGTTGVAVECRPLDVLVPPQLAGSVDWLKIDAEGFEVEILRGGENLLRRTRQIILEVDNEHRDECRALLIERHRFRLVESVSFGEFEYWRLLAAESDSGTPPTPESGNAGPGSRAPGPSELPTPREPAGTSMSA